MHGSWYFLLSSLVKLASFSFGLTVALSLGKQKNRYAISNYFKFVIVMIFWGVEEERTKITDIACFSSSTGAQFC